MNGLQKLAIIGEANGMPSLQTGNRYVTKTGNVGSVDIFWVADLFTFGNRGQGNALRWSSMVSKNQQKIGEANGMPSLPTWPTKVTKTGYVGSVDVFWVGHLFTFGPRGQGIALRRSGIV